MPVDRPASIYQALLQSAGAHDDSAYLLGSQQSVKHSNHSKMTPHSISKMNITEMKQSLS